MEENEPEPVEKEERPPLGGLALLMILPLIGGIVGYFGSALVTYVQPKIYESVMMLQVLPTAREIDPFDGTGSVGSGVTPRFIATEARVITADATLERVGERLNCCSRWGLNWVSRGARQPISSIPSIRAISATNANMAGTFASISGHSRRFSGSLFRSKPTSIGAPISSRKSMKGCTWAARPKGIPGFDLNFVFIQA